MPRFAEHETEAPMSKIRLREGAKGRAAWDVAILQAQAGAASSDAGVCAFYSCIHPA